MRNYLKTILIIFLVVILSACVISCRRQKVTPLSEMTETETTEETTYEEDETELETSPLNEIADSIKIVIDAGHGFDDSGLTADEVSEKNVTLDFANKLRYQLENKGYVVLLTHDGETFPHTEADNGDNVFDDIERALYINSEEPDLVISIHTRYAYGDGAESVRGTSLYYCVDEEFSSDSASVCDHIADILKEYFSDYKEPNIFGDEKANSYYITKNTDCPSVLCEIGYLSNKTECTLLTSDFRMTKTAIAYAEGINSYFIERNVKALQK